MSYSFVDIEKSYSAAHLRKLRYRIFCARKELLAF